jgi:hypothetical protein
MHRTRGCIYDAGGNPMAGVVVTVKKAGTAVNATLYADNGITTKSNGFTNDSDGTFEYYAPNGRYDEVYTKSGVVFTADNSTDLILYDPADDSAATVFRCDFFSTYLATLDFIIDGHHWRVGGGSPARTIGSAPYRGGWMEILESGGVQGSLYLSDQGPALQLNWVATTDVMLFDTRLEKIGDAVAGTRRAGLCSANLGAGDPVDGIYIRQIDTSNAFLVCRASSTEATQDLGVTLNDPKRIRVTITTSSVRAFVDDVAKTPITTNIPTAIMGLSISGGATASAAGIRTDYLNVYTGVRV